MALVTPPADRRNGRPRAQAVGAAESAGAASASTDAIRASRPGAMKLRFPRAKRDAVIARVAEPRGVRAGQVGVTDCCAFRRAWSTA